MKQERDFSTRQLESIKYLGSQQIKAYPLRELVELDDNSQLKDERRLNAIKFTIFFDGYTVSPPNDLYHVPLKKIVPERSVTAIPHLHLRVKKGLDEEAIPHAMKALWWIEQFFNEGMYSIQNSGVLTDPMGIRGAQEKDRYILSVQALKARKKEVLQTINILTKKCTDIDQHITRNTKSLQELNSIIHSVRQSEAFMTSEHERVSRKNKLNDEIVARNGLMKEMSDTKKRQKELMYVQIQQESLERELREEADFYEQLGQLKEKYEELDKQKKKYRYLNQVLKEQQEKLELQEEQLKEIEKMERRMDRELQSRVDSLESERRNLRMMESQKKSHQEKLDIVKSDWIQVMKELQEVQQIIPQIYKEVQSLFDSKSLPSLSHMRNMLEQGRVQLHQARTEEGIDPAAPENYNVIKKEYDRLDNEYKRTFILLEEDMKRTEQLKDQLETTINMRVLELQQRFKTYMSLFQFEGEISWDSYEDRRQRTHFQLYIKARKEGHRGALEDVSIKARGGKVGKGVSGGEESLSSLLFALVLLQNLQTVPGFIVLDEFDSALDEDRKLKVFDLYAKELNRKLIILTPKSHEETYLGRFSKAFVVQDDPTVPRSKVVGLVKVN